MSIEEDIKQKEFESEYQKALVNLMYTNNHIVHKMNVIFKGYGITRQQYNVLRILRGQYPKPASVNLIKERMIDKMSDASRIVERLRVKELITRGVCDNDKRSVDICISEKGLSLLAKADSEMKDFNTIIGNLNAEEAKILNTLLDKLRN